MYWIFVFSLYILSAQSSFANSPQKAISGVVSDKTRTPVIGASVVLKGTSIGTASDIDGKFILSYTDETPLLVISYIGMKTQEIDCVDKTFLNIILEDDAIAMEEVVAIGYVTRKKGELTGSVSTVKSEDIMRTSNSNVAKSLEGKVSGLIINDRGVYPGDNDITMLIRGKATLNDNSPLIVIDGVPGGSLSYLAPSDIESITVLFLDESITIDVTQSAKRPYSLARLAEIYLNYAEAMYHIPGGEAAAQQYASKTAQRVGLPAITTTGDALLEDIKYEREMELFFEGHRLFDLRRWRELSTLAQDVSGVQWEKRVGGVPSGALSASGSLVKIEVPFIEDRKFEPLNYYLPIPRSEVEKAGLEQNWGYN